MTWDFFISHASEDKPDVARPLADMLTAKGFKVWYDEYTLTLGDNLRRSIEQGLAQSRHAVVVLSPHFFAKKWTNLELDGLFALEKPGEKRLLPVWHNVTASDVESYSSFMAMRLGVPTTAGLDQVVAKIAQVIDQDHAITAAEVESVHTPLLHPHSIALLQTAVNSEGRIVAAWSFDGLNVSAGRTQIGAIGDPRAISLNLHCLEELTANGLLEQKSDSFFVVTQEGYDYRLPTGVVDAPRPHLPSVTAANQQTAVDIMKGAAAGSGRVNSLAHLGGHVLSAGGTQWESAGDRRLEARWESALKELVARGLLLQRSYKQSQQSFLVTHIGFLWTDRVNAEAAAQPTK